MQISVSIRIFFYCLCSLCIKAAHAQDQSLNDPASKEKAGLVQSSLFENDSILHFKLTGKLRELLNDRTDAAVYHPMQLQYKNNDSSIVSIPLNIKTRGNFRRSAENCLMPPLLLNFAGKESLGSTVFNGQDKLKLVTSCIDDDYVIREWLVYKLYNLLTEESFKARLVQVDFEDSLKRKKTETHYCILLEDDNVMAGRSNTFILKRKMIFPGKTDKTSFIRMAVFEFMIGNTDWSVPYLHNVRLLGKDSVSPPQTVPYDFDYSGIVNAPYAIPPVELGLNSVKERLYRGYCIEDKKQFDETFTLFNKLKTDFYNVYTSCPLLNPAYVKTTIKYLDDFYKIINSPKLIDSQFGYPCRSKEVIIKGLEN